MRSLTPVEAAVGVAVAGSVLATALPAFVKNLHASRLVEPMDGLERIAGRATQLAAGSATERAYPPSVDLTPAEVPRGEPASDPEGTWHHPTWRTLAFEFDNAHCYSFAFESRNSTSSSTFRATAHGDLDGDGLLSTFRIRGETVPGGEPSVQPLEMYREVE